MSLPINQIEVMSLCDYSENWPRPFRDVGHNVKCYDLKDGFDIRLLPVPKTKVDILLAAPPCTIFAGSGAKWKNLRSIAEVEEGKSLVAAVTRFIFALARKNPHLIYAIENPAGWLSADIGDWDWHFSPCEYAGYLNNPAKEAYTKETYIWSNVPKPPVKPVEPILGSKMHLWYGGRSSKTKTMRSITPLGFAKAFYQAVKEQRKGQMALFGKGINQ